MPGAHASAFRVWVSRSLSDFPGEFRVSFRNVVGKRGGHLWTQRDISLPSHPHIHTPSFFAPSERVITTVYKLIRSVAGEGSGNTRRGVISADLSSASRAAAGSAAAGALISSLAPFRSQGEFLPTDVTPEGS